MVSLSVTHRKSGHILSPGEQFAGYHTSNVAAMLLNDTFGNPITPELIINPGFKIAILTLPFNTQHKDDL